MSPPPETSARPRLTRAQLAEHVGDRSLRRVRWYEVDEPFEQGGAVFGRVAGYQVEASFDPLSTRCTCLYRQRCDHAAVLLTAWMQHPERFEPREVQAVLLPAERTALLTALQAHGPLLDEPIEAFVQRLPVGHALTHRMLDRLGSVLREDVDITPLLPELSARVVRRQRRQAAIESARVWRMAPPKEPVLLGLYEACRAELDDTDLHTPPGYFGQLALGDDESLVVRLSSAPHHALTLPLQRDLLEGCSPSTRRPVAGLALDSLIGSHDPELRAQVLTVLETPLWQRSLAQLDAALARVGPREPMTAGWKLTTAGHQVTRVIPVQLTPYARRSGFRTKKLAPAALTDLPSLDRGPLAALQARAAVPVIVEQLVGHPRVVDDHGELVTVERAELSITVREQAGFHVSISVDHGVPLEPALLGSIAVVGGMAALRRGSRVQLFDVEPVVEGLFGVLARFGDRFPPGARQALASRLHTLEQAVPLALEGSLQGQAVAADLTPHLRLTPLSDGSLRTETVIVPLPGGPAYAPGQGPAELSRLVEGERHFVRRDLANEASQVASVLADLPLAETLLPQQALELVWQLRQRKDIHVVWPQRKLAVRGQVKSLRVGLTRKRNWFGLEAQNSKVSLKALLASVRAGEQFVQIDDKAWMRITTELQDALKLFAISATDEETPKLSPLAASRALLALESAALTVDLPEELVDLEGRIRAAEALPSEPPEGLNATLRPYQLEGVSWLRRVSTWAPGAILADEMGLGKTLQALALALFRGGRTLVVAPASVNFNWKREAERFCPSLQPILYRGPNRVAGDPGQLTITSYELLVRDLPVLSTLHFDTVIFDEAQALKNALTKRSKAARSLDAGFVLALSGTPVENHLLELWSLLRAVAPGLLGPREHFLSRFNQPLMRGQALGEGRLSVLLQPILLRRTKRAVAPELPERLEDLEYVELDAGERVLYERFRQAALGASGKETQRMAVLAALTRLRQIACAAHLVDPEQPAESSKLRRLCEQLELSDEPTLVFSQFTRLLDLAHDALARRDISTLRLDGRTPVAKRQHLVDAFQAGQARVFLIALKAGGTGLNLTAATRVILLDPWWNPASEDQAADRAHRIGQTETVRITRLVSAGTVEEQVLELHKEKRAIAAAVLDGASTAASLSADDLLSLLVGAEERP